MSDEEARRVYAGARLGESVTLGSRPAVLVVLADIGPALSPDQMLPVITEERAPRARHSSSSCARRASGYNRRSKNTKRRLKNSNRRTRN